MTAERRVRQVKLAAASTALVRRGAVLLEDALRTASLPDAPGGRVLVIRRLSLGTIHADRSPATLSLVVEQRMRELARLAVHARSQSAATAQAVYFRDELEPFVLLATRLAQGLPLDAWFWRLAVPGLHPGMSRDDALRLALASALRTEPGHAAAVTLVSELHALGALAPCWARCDGRMDPRSPEPGGDTCRPARRRGCPLMTWARRSRSPNRSRVPSRAGHEPGEPATLVHCGWLRWRSARTCHPG